MIPFNIDCFVFITKYPTINKFKQKFKFLIFYACRIIK
jgi:hypothetical protein